MTDIEQLEDKDVPLIARAWIHNGEILGVTRDGKLLIVARIVGEQKDSSSIPFLNPPKSPAHRRNQRPLL
jgi:hypothetical protein